MTKINDGGPAFPIREEQAMGNCLISSIKSLGMSKRDLIAAMIVTEFYSQYAVKDLNKIQMDGMSELACLSADALIKKLEGPTEPPKNVSDWAPVLPPAPVPLPAEPMPCPHCEWGSYVEAEAGFSVKCSYSMCGARGPLRASSEGAIRAWDWAATACKKMGGRP